MAISAATTAMPADPLDGLAAAIDAVCEADPAALGHGEGVEVLHRQLERLAAATTRATGAFEAARTWQADGARSAAAWISARCHQPIEASRRRVGLARRLRHMPVTERAWLAGDIGEAHVSLLGRARTAHALAAFDRDEVVLVGDAARLTYRRFAQKLSYWHQHADPDGAERSAARRHADRTLHVSRTFGGVHVLDGVLDPIGGAIVARRLKRIEQELFEADWADARARLGDRVAVDDLARTPAQRRADALVEMAKRAGAMPPGARMPEPLFTVLVGYETLAGRICELADGTVVAPGRLVPWLSPAWIERVVFDGPDRVMNVGVRRRLFTGATRRAVEVRDRECFHELCDLPAEDCEIDHIEPYAAGGFTTADNGRPACDHHNRLRHRRTEPPPG